MKFPIDLFGVCEGDWVTYKGMTGFVSRVWEMKLKTRYEIVFRNPDKKIWIEDVKDLKLIYVVS